MKMNILKKIITLIILILGCLMIIPYATSNAANDGATIDSTIDSANDFIKSGKGGNINEQKLKDASNFLYNLLLGIGIIIAVIVGSILGIKYMVGSAAEKAEYKETLLIYLIGCIVIFGAFGIWKIVVNILSKV